MATRFAGKTVLITGASSGIGAELARAFAREGASVSMLARRLDRLQQLQQEIARQGGKALALECDVTDRASIDSAVTRTIDAFGGIDVAVANAGFGVSGDFAKLSTDDFRRQFDTNYFGVLDTVFAVLPHLEKSRGRLALVSSIMGRVGMPASSAYGSSKFAVSGLAECLYFDLADRGISVTCIEPGLVESNIRKTDNRGVVKESRKDPAPALLIMPARKAARTIVNAIYRRKFHAVITGHGKLIVFLARHFPRTVRLVMRASTRGQMARVESAKRSE
jgi:NAD(P)-dependent dehydrogenase (short-subunit alcohol dehydrogenase family)